MSFDGSGRRRAGEPAPLAAAAGRLRRPPGRPRATAPPRPAAEKAVAAVRPRLLGIAGAAAYLGIEPRAIRELIAAGALRPVRLPGGAGRPLRRTLLDMRDLDALVDRAREAP